MRERCFALTSRPDYRAHVPPGLRLPPQGGGRCVCFAQSRVPLPVSRLYREMTPLSRPSTRVVLSPSGRPPARNGGGNRGPAPPIPLASLQASGVPDRYGAVALRLPYGIGTSQQVYGPALPVSRGLNPFGARFARPIPRHRTGASLHGGGRAWLPLGSVRHAAWEVPVMLDAGQVENPPEGHFGLNLFVACIHLARHRMPPGLRQPPKLGAVANAP